MTRKSTRETNTSIARVVLLAAVVIVGSVGAVGTAVGESGLTVDQGPVEYQALDSGDRHVEVIFAAPIDPSNYAFTVLDAEGNVVANNWDLEPWFRKDNPRQVTIELGETDLQEGSMLHVEGENVDMALPITTTSAFIQEGYHHEPEIEPGETIAIVAIQKADRYYHITDEKGTVVEEGTLGEHSFVSAVDTNGWDDDTSYTVKFGRESTFRVFSTVDVSSPEDDDDSLPAHVLRRTRAGFTDHEPDRPGTTVKFGYDLTRASMVVDGGDSYGSSSATVDVWRTTPGSVPAPAAPEDTVSMIDVELNGHTTDKGARSVTVRLPVFMDRVDGDAEDLEVRYYDGEEWTSVETAIVDRTDFYGQEMVTLEATAPGPGSFAVVVGDG